MGDKMNFIIMLVLAIGVGLGIYYWLIASKSGEVRKVDASSQERAKSSQASRPTVAKTAQLSALRERLADAQTTTTGLRKVPPKAAEVEKPAEKSWRPEDVGLADSPTVEDLTPSIRVSPKIVVSEPVAKVAPILVPDLPVVVAPVEMEAVVAKVVEAPKVVEPIIAPVVPVKPVEVVVKAESLVHILLVDDSKVVRVKTEKLLLNKGYSVTTAVDGIDALAKLETLKPSIIITDIEMPNLDGFGLVRNVRGNLRTAEIPVIVMTSHVNLHLDIAATEGINGFLPKPFNDQDLLDQVAFLCES